MGEEVSFHSSTHKKKVPREREMKKERQRETGNLRDGKKERHKE